MAEQNRLLWSTQSFNLGDKPRVLFSYSPGHGLTDVDFHLISERDWNAMKSPAADAVAELQITPQTTIKQLNDVIQTIANLGGYRFIEVTVSQ